ncbi:hypothetical protein K501DRAFT_285112 [Backusella circina FSU 941]|nr:hypothetical protein K501DRAFT_285112 [Backusella circina FSU 941]
MDFASFTLEETEDLFKQNYQLNNAVTDQRNENDFFSFMDTTTTTTANGVNDFHNHHHHHHQNSPLAMRAQSNSNFVMPQLTPDAHDNSFTSSSVLSAHNPEFNMSPLQIASHPTPTATYHTPIQNSVQQSQAMDEEEEFFTPLVSPAMAPTYDSNYQSLASMNHESVFSPLSSPALHPSMSNKEHSTLQQKLAFIEKQQQQLRSMHSQLRGSTASPVLNGNAGYNTSPHSSYQEKKSTSNMASPHINNNNTQHHQFAVPVKRPSTLTESPLALKPMTPHTTFSSNTNAPNFIAPATPSLLMKLGGYIGGVSSPLATPSTPSTAMTSGVDTLTSLPAAMIQQEEQQQPTKNVKRRRISANNSPALSPDGYSPAALRPNKNNNGSLVGSSPRALKPLISPSLKPNGKRLSLIEEETATALLATKSNYEHLKEGKAKSLGIDFATTIQSGIENRRSAHKVAEQKRRDTLKQSFDSLRTEIMDAMFEEEQIEQEDKRLAKEKEVKQMSKVVLLQHSYEYIVRLKNDNKRKDEKHHQLRDELVKLRQQLGLPIITEEEKQEEEREKMEAEERRLARLRRLQTVVQQQQDEKL